jgi:hypothetical protein
MQHAPDAVSATTGELLTSQAPSGTGGGERDRLLGQVSFDNGEGHVIARIPPHRHVVEQSGDALQLVMLPVSGVTMLAGAPMSGSPE